ncbi:hypothetical protein [Flavobacterium sp.]|uniref:hypothetical protein n=1 Tax=Flavobacterium sp. TaxID=239 RepID=UPI00262F0EEF|nr:hypothetical protein [Flavobacterium sp.]
MKKLFLFIVFLLPSLLIAQVKKDSLQVSKSHLESYNEQEKPKALSDNGQFFIYDFSIPFRGNETYGEVDENGNRSDYWFLPDGIGAKFGYGIHFSEWIVFSLNAGFDVVAQQKLFSVPVYGSIVLTPRISDENSILLQYGYGKSFAIGRGNLSGYYNKFRIGFGDDDFLLFADVSLNGFGVRNIENTGSFSLGIAIPTYK